MDSGFPSASMQRKHEYRLQKLTEADRNLSGAILEWGPELDHLASWSQLTKGVPPTPRDYISSCTF